MTQLKKIVIATRSNALALAQADLVGESIQKVWPQTKVEILKITTRGDQLLEQPLKNLTDKNLFVEEIESALLNGSADIAVHRLKDVPAILSPGLMLGSFSKREDPRDVLVFQSSIDEDKTIVAGLDVNNQFLDSVPHGATVGVSNLRRKALLKHYRSDLNVIDLSGSVASRLEKLDDTNLLLDSIVLALADLKRLGLGYRVGEVLPLNQFLPASGQGILTIEARSDRSDLKPLLSALNDAGTHTLAQCERAFVRRLEVSPLAPVAGYAFVDGQNLSLVGFISSEDGNYFIERRQTGSLEQPEELGETLAEELLIAGGGKILNELKVAR